MAGPIIPEEIRCAMTDEQYHALYNKLVDCKALVSLLRNYVGDDADGEVLTGLRLIKERLENGRALMSRYWDETVGARHG